jgi:hypothetical protein
MNYASQHHQPTGLVGFGNTKSYNRLTLPGISGCKQVASPTRLDPKGTFSTLPALMGTSISAKHDKSRGLVFTERSGTQKFLSNVDLVNNNMVFKRTVKQKSPYQRINPLFYKDVKPKDGSKVGVFKDKHPLSFTTSK